MSNNIYNLTSKYKKKNKEHSCSHMTTAMLNLN